MVPASKRPPTTRRPLARPHGRCSASRTPAAGRWCASPPEADGRRSAEDVEQVVKTLLRRYGVIAWRLLEREAAWLPPWRDLVRVCRRLEARGEMRGGRFIAGLSGEQFALPEAVARMREVRRQPPAPALICLAASDPANLLGTMLPGPKLPRTAGSRVLYRDGLPIATLVAGEVTALVAMAPQERHEAARALSLDPGLRQLDSPAFAQVQNG
jgi:ATP-dependent Lhr-like helicase